MTAEELVPGLVGLTLFGVPAGFFGWLLARAVASRGWPTVEGTVTRSVVQKGRKDQASAVVVYEYEVEGRRYTCDRVCFGDFLDLNRADAASTVASFPQGQRVTVRHHPTRPAVGTLRTTVSGFLVLWLLLTTSAAAAIAWGVFAG